MGDPPHGSESENDELVEPVTFKNTHQSDESSATAWDFGSRLQGRPSSSIGGRQWPTRHASLDAGYLQQRVYAAAHVLDRSDASAETGPGVPKPNKSRLPRAASHNEGIEIAWVWPPCLANDTGPVEFAVNVAPREWLNGKHNHRRVPCWPVSGLCLHITFGEQLLQVVELDICGTTKVRLQLPPALTSPHLNFITVMLVDHGKVGPATQLLTMPSSAADEFSGLFRILVEHEMLPHTAAHPEYVSMLFGSSGCSSGSTAHSCNSFRGLNSSIHSGGSGAAAAVAAAAAGAAAAVKGLASPSGAAAGPSAANPAAAAAALACVNGSVLQQQLLLHQGHLHRQQRRPSRKARRYSAGYVHISGTPAVVQRWSSAAMNSPNQLRLTADAGSMLHTGGRAGLTNLHGSSSSNQLMSGSAGARIGRPRRASASDVQFATSAVEGMSCDDSSSRTLTTIDGSFSATSESRVLQLSASVPNASEQQVLDSEQQEGQQQLQDQEQEPEATGQLSVCSSGGLPRYSGWEADLAADAAPAALLLIGDDEDADELHPDQTAAVAAARSSIAGAGAPLLAQHQRQQQQQQHQHQKQLPAEGAAEPEGRKSLSLDRCAVHVHNEVERAQRTRSRMSLDEGNRGSGGQLHMPSDLMSATAGPAATAHPASTAAAAAANTSFAVAASPIDSIGVSNGRDAAAAAAAAAAALLLQAAAAPPAVAQPAASAAGLGRAAAGVGAMAHAEQPAPYPGPAAASPFGLQAGHDDAAAAGTIAHAAAAAPRLFGSSRGLERRTAAEANMSAAFTTAWTCHMLELASDLQYLVVCVPSAFASNLETWFGRIIGSRGAATSNSQGAGGAVVVAAAVGATGLSGVGGSSGGGGGGSGGVPGSSDKRSESSWDSTMYMKRLGQVLDTLQEHNMWTTMSLLLQHCSLGGLDLYPAGCLHQHLQQEQQQVQQQQQRHTQQELPPSQLQLQGPLDPSALTPVYLEHLGCLDVGSASCWVRPVPTIINTQLPCMPRAAAAAPGGSSSGGARGGGLGSSSTSSSGTFGFSMSPYGRMGMQSAREMYLQATGGSRRGTTSIDVTPADLAEARAAAADARAAASMWPSQQAAAAGRSSIGSSSRRQHRQQQEHGQRQHRGPRRSLSWPLGVLYSAFSWAQTAQLRHRQRSFWQRAWGLHSLPEGSERGSESSAASSMDASSFRSSSSTQRSSTVTSLDDAAPWARRVSAGLGRLAGGPAAAVAAAAAAAAGGRGRQQQQQLMQDAERRSSVNNTEGIRARSSYSAVLGRRSDTSAAPSAAAVGYVSRSYDASGVHAAPAGGGGFSDASAASDSNVAQRIAALQNSLLAQAALPPEKVERLKAAVQAKAQKPTQGQQQQQQQVPQQVQQQAGSQPSCEADRVSSAAAGVTAGAAAAAAVGSAVEQQREQQQQQLHEAANRPVQGPDQAVSMDIHTTPGVQRQQQQQEQEQGADAVASKAVPVQQQHQQPPQAPDATAAAAAAVPAVTYTTEESHAGVSSSSSTAPASAVDVCPQAAAAGSSDATLVNQSPAESCTHVDTEPHCSPIKASSSQQRRAAAADAADQKAAVVAAALTVVGVVEQCTSQLLMTLMVPYCLCFLPSILPGLQPPHLVAAMSRRPAWLEGLLLLLISIHWFAVTNVSIVRPSSQRPRNSLEAYRAAVAALRAANAVLAAPEAAGELGDAGATAEGLDVRRQRRREEHKLRKLRDRQQRLLGRAVVSSAVAVAALGLVIYSLLVFVSAWVDIVLGDGASVVWVYRGWNELQQHLHGGS